MATEVQCKRIALLLPDLGGGGAERVAVHLAKGMVARGHAVDLVVLRGGGVLEPLLPPSVRLIDLACPRLRSSLLPIMRYFRRERPDAMLAFMWPLTVIAVLARMLARSPARLVLADHCALSQQYEPALHKRIRRSVRAFYPHADARVLVADGAADDLAQLSGIPRSSLDVILNPVPEPGPIGTDALEEARALWPASGRRILNVGRLKQQKNQALLLQAFALLDKRDEVQLLILGEGPERAALASLAEQLGIGSKLAMPGFHTDAAPIYRVADLFVLSSDYEGLPMVLVEALHAGLPIVSTDCPSGPSEILLAGRHGRLVPMRDPQVLADAMGEALSTPVDPAAQKARAADFSSDRSVEAYLRLLLGRS